jgi:hypothetical protein
MVFPYEHVHSCPECYEDEVCGFTCSEMEYEFEGVRRGFHAMCSRCEAARMLVHESDAMNGG